MGSQNAECIYQAGSYQWSVPLPTCKSADVPDPITVPTEQSPTDSPDDPNDKDITTEDPQPEDCSDGRFSLACWREPRVSFFPKLHRFFDDISISRRNSNGTYRYET